MKSLMNLLARHWGVTALFVLLSAVYVGQAVMTRPSQAVLQKYHLSLLQLHELLLTIALPLVILWLVAMVGYLCLLDYSRKLKSGKDAEGFKWLSWSVFLLILWLPLTSVVSGWGSGYYGNHPDATAALTRVSVYLNMVILVPAFYFAFLGSEKLLNYTRVRHNGMSHGYRLAYIAFASAYTYLMFHDKFRAVAQGPDNPATYYLSDWLILLTVVIPRLFMWYWGIQAFVNLTLFRRKVDGVIYKQALGGVINGLGIILFVSILLRVLQTAGEALNKLNLGSILLLLYLLVILLAIGYIVLAKGARKLQKLEEL
jgi:hypothetical protein